MPKKIILVRHGQTDFNLRQILQGHLDAFLTVKGLAQAKKVANKLVHEEIDIIISSDLKRAYHTALTIGCRINKKVITTSLLRERCYGEFQGKTTEEIQKLVWSFGFENEELNSSVEKKSEAFGVENNKEMKVRLRKLLQQIKKYRNKTIVLVTHAGTIKQFLKLFHHDLKGKIKNTECFYLEKNKDGNYLFGFFPIFNPA